MVIYEDENEDEEDEGDEGEENSVPPVPPGFRTLTAAQSALAELLQMPHEILVAAGRHSTSAATKAEVDIAGLVTSLPEERKNHYLVRLAHNEPGLSRLFVRELRDLNPGTNAKDPVDGERISYATLLAESARVKAQLERERREQERAAH